MAVAAAATLCTPKHTFTTYPTLSSSQSLSLNFSQTKTQHPSILLTSALHATNPIKCLGGSSLFYPKGRQLKLVAAVASEEAVNATEAAEVEEEEKEVVVVNRGAALSQQSTKLYFGNLPYHCDSSQLAEIIQQYAVPELVEVLYDRTTGKSRGFGFVTMNSVEDCKKVIENLDGCEFAGRYLIVNFADKPQKREPYPETEHKLFIGNLAWTITSESLYQKFQEYGNVVGAKVLFDGETGRSKGYGFVSYSTRSEMEKALEDLNGMDFEGRSIRVMEAEGKKS